jgi:WD repeat-containing protein 19
LKDSEFEWASYICSNSEFKKELNDSKFKNKIQAIIRKPNREEKPELKSPCPISGEMISQTDLECPSTKDHIPMCVCTGRHMEIDDWCFCPVSGMPALYSEYIKYLTAEAPNALESMEDAAGALKSKASPSNPMSKMKSSFRNMVSKVVKALDPVTGQMVSSLDLKKCTHEEAKAYIKKYNTFETNKDEDKGAALEEDDMYDQ